MPEFKTVKLSFFQKVKLLASNVDSQSFINIVAPSIENQVDYGEYFCFEYDSSQRLFQYGNDDKGEFVMPERGNGRKIYLNYNAGSNGDSLTDKFHKSDIYQGYSTLKQFYTKGFDVNE